MKNVTWSLIATFSERGFVVIFSIILGNILLPEELGLYIALMLLVVYATTFLTFSLQHGIVKKINDENLPEKKSQYFSAGFLSCLLISAVSIILIYIFNDIFISIFHLEENEKYFFFILPLIPMQIVSTYLNGVLQSVLKIKEMALISIFSTIVRICSAVGLFLLGLRISAVIIGAYAANFVLILFLFLFSLKSFNFLINNKIWSAGKNLLLFSLLLFPSAIAGFLDKKIDIFFVNYLLEKDQVAVYSYAINLALMMLLLGNSISRVTFPKLSHAFSENNKSVINKIYLDSLNFSFFVLSGGSLIVLFHLKQIISIILPDIYLDLIPSFSLLVILIVLMASFSSVGTIFTSFGKPLYNLMPIICSLSVNIILNIILIPKFGILGAAIATGSSYMLRFLILISITERKIGTEYRYWKLSLIYIIFLLAVYFGIYHLNIALKEIVVVLYLIGCYKILLTKSQRTYLKDSVFKLIRK